MQVSIINLWKLKKLLCYYFLINFVCLCLIFEKQKDSNKKRFQLFFPYFVSHLISEKTSHSIIYRFKFKIELSRLYGPKAWSAILQWLCFINNINMLKTHLVWCKFIWHKPKFDNLYIQVPLFVSISPVKTFQTIKLIMIMIYVHS